ncbi:MAG: RtcB family protein [Thermotogaceae bacterium]|nr:RtcB family protein [Thermotogaceae bacterium]
MNVQKEGKYIWRIKKENNMKVDAIIFTDSETINDPQFVEAIKQLMNVATLPGVVKEVYGMPDIHWGYGFPIGGVAAFDAKSNGIISPGAVGFDINCGVRAMITPITHKEIKGQIDRLTEEIYKHVPVGVGSRSPLKFGEKDLSKVCREGAEWAVKNGFGIKEDLNFIEDGGKLPQADPASVSQKAFERGKDELGTLGAGNHFIEIQKVQGIYDSEVAEIFGLFEDQIVVMIHTGSRGFGHQVATDYIKLMRDNLKDHNKNLPDKQLINAPFYHPLGQSYFSAMACAANYAFANREIISHLVRKAFRKVLGGIDMPLLYDIAHNIAKIEEHEINGKRKKLIVHRKGATRSLGSGNPLIPVKYRKAGLPVLIPGNMGEASYIMVGTKKAEETTFSSSAHGAGRKMGRREALRKLSFNEIMDELAKKGISIMSKGKRTVVEEAPQAYKDVNRVVDITDNVGIAKKVAKLVPLGVVKG